MSNDPAINELIQRWHERNQQGETLSVDDLCREHPHLRDAVERRLIDDAGLGPAEVGTVRDEQSGAAVETVAPVPLDVGAEPVPGYRLTRFINGGGFGEVWEAVGPGLFPVALKAVRLNVKAGDVELRALEVIRAIRHPNLMATFGTWQSENRLIIVMELAEETLLDRLGRAKREGQPGIPFDELVGYMAEAAKAIDFLNAPRHTVEGRTGRAVQHRDIKPQNILLIGGSAKVADFGLARVLEQSHANHSGSLTPSYAAPEFFDGKVAHSSDQYSLGVTYCHMRGGRLPFTGTLAQVMKGHTERAPDLTMVPAAERVVVARALAKDPDARWPSCRAFVQALTGPPPAPTVHGQPAFREVCRFEGSAGGAIDLAFLPDGERAITAGHDARLILWEVGTGKEVGRLVGHRDLVFSVAVSADGQLALSVSDDGTARLWDLKARQEVQQLRPAIGKLTTAAFSPSGLRVVVGSGDGALLLYGLGVIDRPDNRGAELRIGSEPLRSLKRDAGCVWQAVFAPDGRWVASAGAHLRLWDVPGQREGRRLVGHTEEVYSVAFGPDARLLVSGGADGTVRVWEPESGAELGCFDGHERAVYQVGVSPDGRHALSAGADGTLRLWRLPGPGGGPVGELHRVFAHTDRVRCAAFAPDGQHVLSSDGQGVKLWRFVL